MNLSQSGMHQDPEAETCGSVKFKGCSQCIDSASAPIEIIFTRSLGPGLETAGPDRFNSFDYRLILIKSERTSSLVVITLELA